MRISLRYKAALLIALAQIVLLGILFISNWYQTRNELERQLSQQADSSTQLVAVSATEPLLAMDLSQLQALVNGFIGKHNITQLAISDHRDQILVSAGETTPRSRTLERQQAISVADTVFGKVKLHLSRTEMDAALEHTMRTNLFLITIAVLLISFISLGLGWFITRKLKALSCGAQAISKGNYSISIPVTSNDEIGDLSQRFNTMAKQLRTHIARIKHGDKRFSDMANNTSDWLWECDMRGRYSYASKQVELLLGYPPEKVRGTSAFDLMSTQDATELRHSLEQMRINKRPLYGFEYHAKHKDGNWVNFELNCIPILDNSGKQTGYRGVTRDLTRRKEDESRLNYLAEHDALTGLLGRQKFIELLDDEIEDCLREHCQTTILFIDLDGFRLINDTHGYIAGDSLLRIISDLLFAQLEQGQPLARLGADEFGVIIPNAGTEHGKALAKRIIQAIESMPLVVSEKMVRLFAGIGICAYPGGGQDSETLLAHADSAMTYAKSLGHNRYHVYQSSDTTLDSMRKTINWKTEIQDALANDRLFLDFQPISPMPHNPKRMYYEALLRLKDRHGHTHVASQFIDIAEHTGQISEIDKWVLRRVIKTLHATRHDNSCISINLSGRSLRIPDYCDYFHDQIQASAINPKRIMFEITETAAVLEIAKAENFLSRMKKLGYRFSLDDFGAGFSSFSYLKHLPVDQIKLDGSFIQHLDKSREDQIFVRAIVQIAKELGLETVAEYVQSQATLDILTDIGVDYVQGHHISRPSAQLLPATLEFGNQSTYKLHTR